MATGATYGRLIQLSGWTFIIVGFLGRVPLAMSQVGVLVLVSQVSGSYAAGGFTAGVLAIANAVGAPLAGNLTDRIGQRWVVTGQSLVGGIGLVAIVLAARAGFPLWVVVSLAALAGAFLPQIGTMARVRWREIDARHPSERGRILATAFSWEGAADEASFVLGPALIGGLSLLGGAPLGLSAAGVVVIVCGTWFAHHPTSALVTGEHPTATAARQSVWSWPLVVLIAAMLMIGTFFGSIQTGSSVLATAAGAPGMTGLLHAVLGIGSVLAGLLLPLFPPRISLARRWQVFTTGLVLFSLPLLLVGHIGLLVVILLLVGVFVAPSMITVFSLGEQVAPPERLGTAMTLIASVTSLGYATGAGLAGPLADWGGHGPAFGVTIAAAGLMCLIAVFAARVVAGAIAARVEESWR